MDTDSEVGRAKWLLFGAVLFLVGAWISYRELVYLLRGSSVASSSVHAYEVEKRGRWGLPAGTKMIVDYEFTDAAGNRRRGTDTMSSDWELPESGQVVVRYTPGADGSSRLTGHTNWIGISIFAISLIYISIAGYRFWRHVNEAVNGPKSRRKTKAS